jgi:urease gamma subunit
LNWATVEVVFFRIIARRTSTLKYFRSILYIEVIEKLMLAPREMEKMVIWTAAQIAEGRKKKGVKLNYPEAIAYIANFVVEGAREGKTVADLMKSAREILKSTDVMKGVPEMIHTVQVEATFPDGTKLVTVHDPVY